MSSEGFTLRIETAYRPVPGLTVVKVADETLIYDRSGDQLHHLDPISTVVWSELDGTRSLDSLCADLAASYDAPIGQVTSDVGRLITRLAEAGLVRASDDRVSPPVGNVDSVDDAEPAPVPAQRTFPVVPSLCRDKVAGMGWHATDTIERDGWFLGVRSADPDTRQRLIEHFGGSLVAEPQTDANVSIRPPGVESDSLNELGQVYAECTLVARERRWTDLLTALNRELDARLLRTRADGVSLRTCVLRESDGHIWLAPPNWWSEVLGRQSRLRSSGTHLLARDLLLKGGMAVVPGQPGVVAVTGVYTGLSSELTTARLVGSLLGWVNNADVFGPDHTMTVLANLAPDLATRMGPIPLED